jgi:hypothetical protein
MGLVSYCVLEFGLRITSVQRFLLTATENSCGQFENRNALLRQPANILLLSHLDSFGFIMLQGFRIDYSGGAM